MRHRTKDPASLPVAGRRAFEISAFAVPARLGRRVAPDVPVGERLALNGAAPAAEVLRVEGDHGGDVLRKRGLHPAVWGLRAVPGRFRRVPADLEIVDAHHHLWDLVNHYPWLSEHPEPDFLLGDYTALKRNYLPDDYRIDAHGLKIVATVHVEAEHDRARSVDETAWLHQIHAQYGMPNAVVAHAFLHDQDLEKLLLAHKRSPLVRGIRCKPVREGPGSMHDPNWRRGMKLLDPLFLVRYRTRGARVEIRRISAQRIWKVVKALGRRAGMPEFTLMRFAMAAGSSYSAGLAGICVPSRSTSGTPTSRRRRSIPA